MTFKIVVLSLYALMIVVIGITAMRKTKSFSDYFLGGGKIGAWMTAFTYGTAYFSAVLFIGFAGKIGWSFGYSGLWVAIGNALLGVLGVWWLIGWRTKKMSLEYKVSTLPEFMEKRYGSGFLKLFSAVCIFIFFIPYSAAVFIGLSYLFQSNFNIEYTYALIFMGTFTAFYLVTGGYRSMTMIDVIFGIIMTAGVMVLLTSVTSKGGGFSQITASLKNINPELISVVGPPGFWPLFCLVFLTSVAPFAMPQLIQKFYAIKDKTAVKRGMIFSSLFAIFISAIAYFTGATSRIFLSAQNAPNAFKGGKPVFDALIPELLDKVVPQSLSILMLILILSASMSTLAALVLISSSSLAKDIYAGFMNKNASDKKLTVLMRFASAFFILLSVILAYFKPSTIVAILAISWGAIGSAFLGPFIWGLFTKRAGKFGAIASSTLGLLTCLILYMEGRPSPEAGTIGMMVSLGFNLIFVPFWILRPTRNRNT